MNPLSRSLFDRMPGGRTLRGVLLLVLLLGPASLVAADPPERLAYGFTGAIGYGRALGNASDFLDDTWSSDFNLFLEKGRFRGGIGIEFHRFKTVEPVPFPEVSAIPFYALRDVLSVAKGAGPALPAGATRAGAAA